MNFHRCFVDVPSVTFIEKDSLEITDYTTAHNKRLFFYTLRKSSNSMVLKEINLLYVSYNKTIQLIRTV